MWAQEVDVFPLYVLICTTFVRQYHEVLRWRIFVPQNGVREVLVRPQTTEEFLNDIFCLTKSHLWSENASCVRKTAADEFDSFSLPAWQRNVHRLGWSKRGALINTRMNFPQFHVIIDLGAPTRRRSVSSNGHCGRCTSRSLCAAALRPMVDPRGLPAQCLEPRGEAVWHEYE